jgi:MurNAc alpha-1-phosphate uridylyltransferase
MKGMILTAGLGTRLMPLTDKTPKALVKVGDYSMLDLAIMYFHKHGVDDIIINVHHFADQLMEYVSMKRWEGYKIEISNETDCLLNTGGGLKKASWFFEGEENFALMAVDVLTDLNLTKMIKQHKASNSLVTLAVKKRDTSRDLIFDAEGWLAGWKDNRNGETKVVEGKESQDGYGFSGIHVINTKLFSEISEQGAFSIVDMYLRLAETEKIKSFDHSDGKWIEFGRVENIKNAKNSPDYKVLLEQFIK